MAFSFGILGEIDSVVATIAFVATIFFLTGFEVLTDMLEYIVRDNPIYNQMLQRIYKELMIMGFITFVIAMYLASHNSVFFSKHITEIDFVGYITFFVAIFFVAHAMYIMILSMHTTKVYARLHSIHVGDLISDFPQQLESKVSKALFNVPYLPLSSLRQHAEFKIIYALFRDTYWLPSDFDYGSYLARSFEKYSLRMINIGLSSWLIMIFLCGVNYLRIVLSREYGVFSCEGGDNDNEELSEECSFLHLKIFVVCGAMIAFYASILFLIGRFYLKRLIARAGVTCTPDYYKFLLLEESITLKQAATRTLQINRSTKRGRRMSTNTFRNNVHNLLREKSQHEKEDESFYHTIKEKSRRSSSRMGRVMSSLFRSLSMESYSSIKPEKNNSESSQHKKSFLRDDEVAPRQQRLSLINKYNKSLSSNKDESAAHSRRKNMVIKLTKGSTKKDLHQTEAEDVESLTSIEQFKLIKIKEMRQQKIQRAQSNKRMMMSYLRDKTAEATSSSLDMKLTEDFSDIYFFKSPHLYFKMVEVAIMLNSLYLSLWACNFVTLVNEHFGSSPFYHIVMLVPLLVVLPSLGEIVKVSSLLAAIAELDLDVIGSVLEDTEQKMMLVQEVRDKILARIHGKKDKDKMVTLTKLFEEIDSNGNGVVSEVEVREMLRLLSLHYSDNKFRKLYAAIDQDGSGVMDMDEFMELVFPAMHQKIEVKRRAVLLKQHSDAYDDGNDNNKDLGPHQPSFKSTIERFKTDVQLSSRGRAYSEESAISDEQQHSERKLDTDEDMKCTPDDPISNVRVSQILKSVPCNDKNDNGDMERIEEEQSITSSTSNILCCSPQQSKSSRKYPTSSHSDNECDIRQSSSEEDVNPTTNQHRGYSNVSDQDFLDFFNKNYNNNFNNFSDISPAEIKCNSHENEESVSVLSGDNSYIYPDNSLDNESCCLHYESDDNSLMTATIRGNQQHSPEKKSSEFPVSYKMRSIEVTTLLHNEEHMKIRENENLDNIPSFELNQRAAAALHFITSNQRDVSK